MVSGLCGGSGNGLDWTGERYRDSRFGSRAYAAYGLRTVEWAP